MSEFQLEFPPGFVAKIQQMHEQVYEINRRLEVIKNMHYVTRVQSKLQLLELGKEKADRDFAIDVENQGQLFSKTLSIEISEFCGFCESELSETQKELKEQFQVLKQLPEVKSSLIKLKEDELIPCIAEAASITKQLISDQEKSQSISQDIFRLIREYEHATLAESQNFSDMKEQLNKSKFNLSQVRSQYQNQYNSMIYPQFLNFQELLQNIDLSQFSASNLQQQIKNQAVTATSDLLHASQLGNQADYEVKQMVAECRADAAACQQNSDLARHLEARHNYYLGELRKRFESFKYQAQLRAAEGLQLVGSLEAYWSRQVSEHFPPGNALAAVAAQIAALQEQWRADVQDFQRRFVEGALEAAKQKLVDTFEVRLAERATETLQGARKCASDVAAVVESVGSAQRARRARESGDFGALEKQLRVLHGQITDMQDARERDAQAAGFQLAGRLVGQYMRTRDYCDAGEARELLRRKLDKQQAGGAFTVTCPAERYEDNALVDGQTATQAARRLASEPLNVERGGIAVARVPNSALQGDVFVKTEPTMNTLAFGQEVLNASLRKQLSPSIARVALQSVPQVLAKSDACTANTLLDGAFLSATAFSEEDAGEQQGGASQDAATEQQTQHYYVKLAKGALTTKTHARREFRRQAREGAAPSAKQEESQKDCAMHPYNPPMNRWGNRDLWKLGRMDKVNLDEYLTKFREYFE